MIWKIFSKYSLLICILVCVLFFAAYSTLSIVRHNHYQSFGYDLGINDQVVWRYSRFEPPLTTIDPFPDKTKFAEHIELVYVVIAPFYWIWTSPLMLLLVQAGFFCSSGIAVYLLSRKYKLSQFLRFSILITYLMFYGVQFGLWTDVHSSIFAAAFFMGFIYFLDIRQKKLSFLFFFLTLTAKESTSTALFCISIVYFFYRREKILLLYAGIAVAYTLFVFLIFYPYIMHEQYLYANHKGILSDINPLSLINTQEKQVTIFYTFASWGFLPLFSPLFLLPILSHFYKFFVVASDLSGAQGLFGQYRIMLAPILAVATMWTVKKFKNSLQVILGIWLLISVAFSQYSLHLPLSYLIKSWFWTVSPAVKNINTVVNSYLPKNTSVVSQNNITPHISERDTIYTLYPEKKTFSKNSPCGQKICAWFHWYGNPQFLIVDTSTDWDIRHLLTDRPQFLAGLQNLEKAKVITKYKQIRTSVLYKVNENPDAYK